MSARSDPLAFGNNYTIAPHVFSDAAFSVQALLASLTQDALSTGASVRAAAEGPAAEAAATAMVEKGHKLLSVLDKAQAEMRALHTEVSGQSLQLERKVTASEATVKAELGAVEGGLACIREGLKELEGRLGAVSATARVVERLQAADALRSRCTEASRLISYMLAFSRLPHGQDTAQLPPLFSSADSMGEAAATARLLVELSREVLSTRERSSPQGALAAPQAAAAAAANGGSAPNGVVRQQPRPSGQQRGDAVTNGGDAKGPGGPAVGSVEYGLARLEEYCSWLEGRLVDRFDAASAERDLDVMADCAAVMSDFDRERTITQRYVATRPIFATPPPPLPSSSSSAAALAAGQPATAVLQPLRQLYQEIQDALESELEAMCAVLPDAASAVEMMVQRLLMERVQPLLDSLLDGLLDSLPLLVRPDGSGGGGASSANGGGGGVSSQLRSYLALLVEAGDATAKFTAALQALLAQWPPLDVQVDVAAMVDGCLSSRLTEHAALELRWLHLSFHQSEQHVGPPRAAGRRDVGDAAAGVLQAVLARQGEALARAVRLAPLQPPERLPQVVRLLFAGAPAAAATSTSAALPSAAGAGAGAGAAPVLLEAAQGCLLEQVALYMLRQQLEPALEAVAGQQVAPAPAGGLSASACLAWAEGLMRQGGSMQRAFSVARTACDVAQALQQHYADLVLPQLSGAPWERAACGQALGALLQLLQDSVLALLRKATDAFMAQVEALLAKEQKSTDFLLRDGSLDQIANPTAPCLLITALLDALRSTVRAHLDGGNAAAFLHDAAERLHGALGAHMLRWQCSSTGGMRWKADVSRYAQCIQAYGSAAASERMAQLQALANVLIVAPDSLSELVSTELRLPPREALMYVQLREDFRTAKLASGQSLQQAFAQPASELS